MDAPSMVHRSGDDLIIRSVVSGDQLYFDKSKNDLSPQNLELYESLNRKEQSHTPPTPPTAIQNQPSTHDTTNNKKKKIYENNNNYDDDNLRKSSEKDEGLPQCKIKRNYSCSNCTFFTQNPRHYLIHLRDKHGEKIVINECKLCLYASRHYQKLVRHMKMVHGSTEGLDDSGTGRKRASNIHNKVAKKRKTNIEMSARTDIVDQMLIHPIFQSHITFPPSITIKPTAANRELILQQQQQQQQMSAQHQEKPLSLMSPSLVAAATSAAAVSTPPTTSTQSQPNPSTNDKKTLKCAVCDFQTSERQKLVDHEKNDHIKTKFFRCIKCNYVTHIKARYSKHVKYHSMPMIKCMMCDFRTPYKWNLDRHMKNHGGAGPFKCSACNFTADIKQSLTVHEMNHHVPPVGHITNLVRRKNKVGGTDLSDDNILSDAGVGGVGVTAADQTGVSFLIIFYISSFRFFFNSLILFQFLVACFFFLDEIFIF